VSKLAGLSAKAHAALASFQSARRAVNQRFTEALQALPAKMRTGTAGLTTQFFGGLKISIQFHPLKG